MPTLTTSPIGCILAGGRSSRLGGGDKALEALGGTTLLGRVIAALAPQVSALALNANGDPARFAAYGLPVVPDTLPDHPGPLAGLLAAMDWAAAHHPAATHVVTAAADTPFFPASLVEALRDAATGSRSIAVAASDGGRHPVFGLFPLALRNDLAAFLLSGATRKVTAWIDRHPAATVRFPPLRVGDDLVDPFFNVNTTADLDAARRIAARLDAPGDAA